MVRQAEPQLNRFTWRSCLCVILWLILCACLTSIGLHQLAFILSILIAMFAFGFKERWASDRTASAYSVFNEGGSEILGTFNATKFDRQMRGVYGGALDHDGDSGASSVANPTHKASRGAVEKIDADERIRRRQNAAAAAEKRLEATAESRLGAH